MADIIYNIFDTLVTAIDSAKVVSKSNIFLGNRPIEKPSNDSAFIVISLPSELEPQIKGNKEEEMQTTTNGVIYLYVKAKTNGTLNPGTTTTALKKLRDLFPIKSEYVTCVRPRRGLGGYDGYGYFMASITFRIRTNPINQ